VNGDGLTVKDLLNRFLTVKQNRVDSAELSPRTFRDYKDVCDRIITAFGPNRLVIDLAADDFESLRAEISNRRSAVSVGNEVQRTRTIFRYAYEAGLIDKPVRFGPDFVRPKQKALRKQRRENGKKLFSSADINALLDAAPLQLKTMILLGINCAFGNGDCGTLPMSVIDLKTGWIDYPRPKTEVERRCPLWQETVAALREWLSVRLPPRSPNLNAYLERYFGSLKSECLNKMIFFGDPSLRRAVKAFLIHYHDERNHQGLGNRIISPSDEVGATAGKIECRERLGGMLRYYHRAA